MKTLSLSKPHILVTVGVPGAGKSFFAEKFANTFQAPCINLDNIRYIISRNSPTYERDETIASKQIASEMLDKLLLTKNTIVLDGDSDTKTERQELYKKAHSHGYKVLLIWVQTDTVTSRHRSIVGTKNNPAKWSGMSSEQYNSLLKKFIPPKSDENVVVISGKHTYATQAKTVLKRLAENRQAAVELNTPPPRPTKTGRHITVR